MPKSKLRKPVAKTSPASVLEKYFDEPRPQTSIEFNPRGLCETDAEALALVGRLGPTPIGGIFGETSDRRIPLPETQLQKDLKKCDVGEPPEGYDYVAQEETFHPFRGFTRAQTSHSKRPTTMDQEQHRLLRPHDRVVNLQHAKQQEMAIKMIRKAKLDRERMILLMRKQHPNGIVGVDTPSNLESEVYAHVARSIVAREDRLERIQQHRSANILYQSCAKARLGYNVTDHDNDAPVHGQIGQSRNSGHPDYNPKFQDTHHRVFYQRRRARNTRRQQHIVNMASNGRNYDIVTGVVLSDHVKPDIPERINKQKDHPSHFVAGWRT